MAAFIESGFDRTTIEEIAKRAGAAKGTVYLYFNTKEELFEETLRQQIGPVYQQMRSGFEERLRRDPDISATELLRDVITLVYAQMVSDPQRRALLRIMIAESERFPEIARYYYEELLSGVRDLLPTIVRRGVERGEFRESPVATHAEVIMGPTIMAAVWKMTFDHTAPLDIERHAEAHLDLILHGLLRRDH